jgi:hypothetical protein
MTASRALAASFVLALVTGSDAFASGSRLLGGFQPVAVESGARAAWICPAALAQPRTSQLMLEGVFLEQAGSDFSELSFLSLGTATEGRAYGWQLELEDLEGVPDWTFAAAQAVGRGRRISMGSVVEVRGGEGTHFDGGVGLLLPLGRTLRTAIAVEDLFEAEVDGQEGVRHWRGGAAVCGRQAWLSWDWRAPEGERGLNVFAAGLSTTYARLSAAVDEDGGWVAQARLVLEGRAAGGGVSEPESGPGSRFAAVEVGGSPRRVR